VSPYCLEKNWRPFLVIALSGKWRPFLAGVFSLLPSSHVICLVFFVNSATKKIILFGTCYTLDTVTRGGPLVTPLGSTHLRNADWMSQEKIHGEKWSASRPDNVVCRCIRRQHFNIDVMLSITCMWSSCSLISHTPVVGRLEHAFFHRRVGTFTCVMDACAQYDER